MIVSVRIDIMRLIVTLLLRASPLLNTFLRPCLSIITSCEHQCTSILLLYQFAIIIRSTILRIYLVEFVNGGILSRGFPCRGNLLSEIRILALTNCNFCDNYSLKVAQATTFSKDAHQFLRRYDLWTCVMSKVLSAHKINFIPSVRMRA